jgi:hypothetical protein
MTSAEFLFTEPIATALCVWLAFAWGCLYLFLESIPLVFKPYGFVNASNSQGLAFTGLAVGALSGFGLWCILEWRRDKSTGEPEKLLTDACAGGIIFAIGECCDDWVDP